jgi:hypothetical protein
MCLLQVQQVSAHLRFFQRRRIAAVPGRQLADKPQILLLRRRRQRAVSAKRTNDSASGA